MRAYKYTEKRTEHLDLSIEYLETAQEALYSTQHDIFTDWYAGDKSHGKFNIPAKLTLLHNLRDRYGENKCKKRVLEFILNIKATLLFNLL